MSNTIRATVVCGFTLDIHAVTKEVHNVDEETGEETVTTEHSHNSALVNGVKIGTDEEFSFAVGSSFEGLAIGEIGISSGELWIGAALATASDDHGHVHMLTPSVPAAVAEFAQKHNVEPQFFLTMNADQGTQ